MERKRQLSDKEKTPVVEQNLGKYNNNFYNCNLPFDRSAAWLRYSRHIIAY